MALKAAAAVQRVVPPELRTSLQKQTPASLSSAHVSLPFFPGKSNSCSRSVVTSAPFRREEVSVALSLSSVAAPSPGYSLPQHLVQNLTVADCMSKGTLHVAKETMSVDEALDMLVAHRISGMPVVDQHGRVVGLVSDYDLLALDSISGDRVVFKDDIFPAANSTWKAFKEIHKLLEKNRGRTVADVMTRRPLCVRPRTNLEDAARVLLETEYRRLPVVDETGCLVGLLTRGNVVRAAIQMKRKVEGKTGDMA